MRMFLPIKGPGGRALTPNEKIALLVLALTLVLCVLTLLAGEGAFGLGRPRNPVFAFVALLGGLIGGGIVAFYGIVLLWSALVYFRGERVARVAPLGGRLLAAFAVAVGVSGALGIARLGTAGDLGLLVGGAIANRFGAGVGFPLLLLMMMLGIHLASQGAWTAMRDAAFASAGATLAPPSGGFGLTYAPAPRHRVTGPASLPDDGDPSADERTFAVTQAMEEIERDQGVTIVDVVPESVERSTIGEEVEQAPPPAAETDEADILRRLREVRAAIEPVDDLEVMDLAEAAARAEALERAPEQPEEPPYEIENHGHVPVPVRDEIEPELRPVSEVPASLEAAAETSQPAEEQAAEVDALEVEDAPRIPVEPVRPVIQQTHFSWKDTPIEVMDIADVVSPEPPEDAVAEEAEVAAPSEPEGDPYAQPGLLKRLPKHAEDPPPELDRPYTNFDWRGRPLE